MNIEFTYTSLYSNMGVSVILFKKKENSGLIIIHNYGLEFPIWN